MTLLNNGAEYEHSQTHPVIPIPSSTHKACLQPPYTSDPGTNDAKPPPNLCLHLPKSRDQRYLLSVGDKKWWTGKLIAIRVYLGQRRPPKALQRAIINGKLPIDQARKGVTLPTAPSHQRYQTTTRNPLKMKMNDTTMDGTTIKKCVDRGHHRIKKQQQSSCFDRCSGKWHHINNWNLRE